MLFMNKQQCPFHITSFLTELCVIGDLVLVERGHYVMLIIESIHLINLQFETSDFQR